MGIRDSYKPIKGKEAIISDLKKSAKAADTVYLATDPDREGEAISWHLKSLLDLPDKKTKRVTFNEITKNVVRQSIQHPRDIDQNLVDAQQARRILDLSLIHISCIAAVATIRREFNSTLKTVGVVLMQCCVAWIVAFVVYTLVGIL